MLAALSSASAQLIRRIASFQSVYAARAIRQYQTALRNQYDQKVTPTVNTRIPDTLDPNQPQYTTFQQGSFIIIETNSRLYGPKSVPLLDNVLRTPHPFLPRCNNTNQVSTKIITAQIKDKTSSYVMISSQQQRSIHTSIRPLISNKANRISQYYTRPITSQERSIISTTIQNVPRSRINRLPLRIRPYNNTTNTKTSSSTALRTIYSRLMNTTVTPPSSVPGTVNPDLSYVSAQVSTEPIKKKRGFFFKLFKWGSLFTIASLGLYYALSSWVVNNLDTFMGIYANWTNTEAIHYYAHPDRINNVYKPIYTGDKVTDIRLLQTKLIKDIFTQYLQIDGIHGNMDPINDRLRQTLPLLYQTELERNPDFKDTIGQLSIDEFVNEHLFTSYVLNDMRFMLVSLYVDIISSSPTNDLTPETLDIILSNLKYLEKELDGLQQYFTMGAVALAEVTMNER